MKMISIILIAISMAYSMSGMQNQECAKPMQMQTPLHHGEEAEFNIVAKKIKALGQYPCPPALPIVPLEEWNQRCLMLEKAQINKQHLLNQKLLESVAQNKVKEIERALANGAHINQKEDFTWRFQHRDYSWCQVNALDLAISLGLEYSCEILMYHGAKLGNEKFMLAAKISHPRIYQIIIIYGAHKDEDQAK